MRITLIFLGLLLMAGLAYFFLGQMDVEDDASEKPVVTASEFQNQKVRSVEENSLTQADASSFPGIEDDSEPYIVDCTGRQFQADDNLDNAESELTLESFEPPTEEEIQQAMEDQEKRMEEARRQTDELIGGMSSDQSLDGRLSRALIRVSNEYSTAMLSPNIEKSGEAGIASLREITQDYPQSELAHNLLLLGCSAQPTECSESDELNAVKAAGTNGYIWFQVAVIRIAREDTDGSLDAIRQATFASTFDEYWYQTTELIRQNLPHEIYETDESRIGFGMGVASSNLPAYQHLTGFCRAESAANASAANACVDFGERIEIDGKTILSNMMGRAFQRIVYEEIGDESSLARVEQAKAKYESYMRSEQNAKAQTLMMYDWDLHEFWWREVGFIGELHATESLVQEAIERSKVPNYNPCPKSDSWK